MNQNTTRTRIAEAVHRAVCEYTKTDGFGCCMHYAAAGAVLASRVFGHQYTLQAGSLYVVADPPDGAVAFEFGKGGGFEGGEYHCWFTRPFVLSSGENQVEVVDLSSRHYKAYSNMPHVIATEKCGEAILHQMDLAKNTVQWTRAEEPPDFVWLDGGTSDLMRLMPDAEATDRFLRLVVIDHADEYRALIALAWRHFHTLTGCQAVEAKTAPIRNDPRVGRNDPCPCGSGWKYKKCCMGREGGNSELWARPRPRPG